MALPLVLGMVPMVGTDPCPDSWAELGRYLLIDLPPFVNAQRNPWQGNGLRLLEPLHAQRALVHSLRHDTESDLEVSKAGEGTNDAWVNDCGFSVALAPGLFFQS